jgi:hypothetical protein
MAVGHYATGGGIDQTLVESWNGTAWSIVASPNPGGSNALSGVSCVSASTCVTVGSSFNGTLVESWNGSAWSVVPSPSPGTFGFFSGVSCVSSSACTAVGYYVNDSSAPQTLIESWDGSAWSVVASPNVETRTNALSGVSCVSASVCTAVGYYIIRPGVPQTLTEYWNGTSWSVVTSPNPGTTSHFNVLSGVSCVTASACTAVGSYRNAHVLHTLVESWNGSAWSVVPSPDPGTRNNALAGASCLSATPCTAVGFYGKGGLNRTLVEVSS